MTSYSFDEEGIAFYFFILTLVGIYVIPATIRLLWPKTVPKSDLEPVGNAPESEEKARRLIRLAAAAKAKRLPKYPAPPLLYDAYCVFSGAIAFLIFMWVVFFWSLYSACNVTITHKLYDPFEILGVSSGASESEIKIAFKKLSRKHHPDKAPAEMREDAEALFVEISKAYKALTDEKTRKNWEEYGNPDGIRSFALGVALPAWMVSSRNKFVLIVLYLAAFGFGIPLLVGSWWRYSKSYSKSGVRHESMKVFFQELKENSGLKKIFELIANSVEFKDELKEGPDEKKAMGDLIKTLEAYNDPNDFDFEKPRKIESAAALKAYALLYCHFHRITVEDPKLLQDQAFIVAQSVKIIQGILQIALSRDWLHPILNCFTLSACLTQAMWDGQPPLLQLPYINLDIVKHFTSGKRSVKTIDQFIQMADADRRAVLRTLTDVQYEDVLRIAQTFPQVHVSNVSFKILGQEKITPGGIITCQVRLNLEYPKILGDKDAVESEDTEKDDKMEEDVETFEFDEDGNLIEDPSKRITTINSLPTPVYCPRFPNVKRPIWWVALVNKSNTDFVAPPVKVTDLVDKKTITLQIQAPPKPMNVAMQLVIKCDSVLGSDVAKDIHFTVYPASEVPASPIEKWDISGDEGDGEFSFGSGGGHHCASC